MWQVAALVAAFIVFSFWSSQDARRKLRARLRDKWGSPRREPPDLDNIADFFRSHPTDGALDDRTWADLLMDEVFAYLDRTESSVGQQMLYSRLRCARRSDSLDAFEAMVGRFSDDTDLRARAQVSLARLRHSSGYYLHRLVRPDTLTRPWWYGVFPFWTALIVSALALGFVWHGLFLIAIAGFSVNVVIRIVTSQRVRGEAVWFRLVGPLLSSARMLADLCDQPATATVTGRMKTDLAALRRLGAVARWVSRGSDTGAPTDLIGAIVEYINIQLLM